jgi:hypothetical protein
VPRARAEDVSDGISDLTPQVCICIARCQALAQAVGSLLRVSPLPAGVEKVTANKCYCAGDGYAAVFASMAPNSRCVRWVSAGNGQ